MPSANLENIIIQSHSFDSASVNSALLEIAKVNDSIINVIDYYQNVTEKLIKDTEVRQNDLRQETNNTINKFNGDISLWLCLLGIVCGLAPLLIGLYNSKSEAEFIKSLKGSNDVQWESIKDNLNIFREGVNNSNKSQKEDIANKLKTYNENELTRQEFYKKLKLIQCYVYIATVAKQKKFQGSSNRRELVEIMLYSLAHNAYNCLDPEVFKKDKYVADYIHCIISLKEGLELLETYIEGRTKSKIVRNLIRMLEELQDVIFKGSTIDENMLITIRTDLNQISCLLSIGRDF